MPSNHTQETKAHEPSPSLEEAVEARIKKRYGREYERWALDKRAEVKGFVRAEVEQAFQVLGDPIAAAEDKGRSEERARLREVWKRAMADPGSFVARGIDPHPVPSYANDMEDLIDWQLRALLAALDSDHTDTEEGTGRGSAAA